MAHERGHARPHMQEPVFVSDASPGPNYAVTRSEVKEHLRIDASDEDSYLDTLIAAAHNYLSGWNGLLGEVLITQTWRVSFDEFPKSRRINIPLGPIQSVTLKYYDGDNALQTYSSDNYAVLEDATGPYLYRDESEDAWPDTFDREDAVQVTVTAGHGPNAGDVPDAVRMAMFHIIAHWYRNREAVIVGQSVANVPIAAEALLANYKRHAF